MSAPPDVTGRPPIVATFPNGVMKLYCPCAAVLVFNPATSTEPPARCAFCKRRYQWPNTPGQVDESGRRENGHETVATSVRGPVPAAKARDGAPPPVMWTGTVVNAPLPQSYERIRSSKRMCVVCCRVKPAPRHEVLRAAIAGIAAQWIWLCDGPCLEGYQARGAIGQYSAPNNWNVVNYKESA